jgi:hypothetical protein
VNSSKYKGSIILLFRGEERNLLKEEKSTLIRAVGKKRGV